MSVDQATIVAGLTEWQRSDILAMTDEWPIRLMSEVEADKFPPGTLLWRPNETNRLLRSFRLSPLGLSVRALLA